MKKLALTTIKLNCIHADQPTIRLINTRKNRKYIEELAKNISIYGLKKPLSCLLLPAKNKKWHYELIIGFHRYLALKKLQKKDPLKYDKVLANIYEK